MNLRETIRQLTNAHLDAGHIVCGQNLSAVGWVGGTLPERTDMVELPNADVAGSAFAVGMALAGKRPVFIVRYQGFNWLTAWAVVNYAAKSDALWGRPCPMLVRSIAMEGRIGPVAGSSHHSLFYRMPGVRVYAPMTPGEWAGMYREFMMPGASEVFYASEHRGAWGNDTELLNIQHDKNAQISIYAISITRFAAMEAQTRLSREGIRADLLHISQLKPLLVPPPFSAKVLVLDDDYEGGAMSHIALELHRVFGTETHVLGLPNRTAGFADWADVLPPTAEQIVKKVKEILK